MVAFKESLYTAARSFKFNDLIRDEVALPFVQLDEIKNTIYWYILNYTLLVDGQFKTIDARPILRLVIIRSNNLPDCHVICTTPSFPTGILSKFKVPEYKIKVSF